MTPVVVEADLDIRRSPEDVFDYCSDASHEPEWNPMMKRIFKLTDGPVRVGTRYKTEFVNGPAMVIECVRYERPTRWSTNGDSDALTARGDGRVVPTSDGAHLVMRMELEPHGLLKLTTPVLRRRLTRMFQRDLENIKARLEAAERDSNTATTARAGASGPATLDSGGIADDEHHAAVDLYWLPLGAGGRCVPINGRIFEFFSARLQHRDPCDLYHSALEVQLGRSRYVIEMAPVWNERSTERGVVGEGAVGHRQAGRFRLFRYEIRRWRDGRIPDANEAVDSPRRLTSDPAQAIHILDLVAQVPTAVWGRDDLKTGDMWNSNSLISWLIARSGVETTSIHPPAGGRAPGWQAGLVLAAREINLAVAETQTNAHLVHV
jgi:uncharacterized protein YndB with AHSA1/START domain